MEWFHLILVVSCLLLCLLTYFFLKQKFISKLQIETAKFDLQILDLKNSNQKFEAKAAEVSEELEKSELLSQELEGKMNERLLELAELRVQLRAFEKMEVELQQLRNENQNLKTEKASAEGVREASEKSMEEKVALISKSEKQMVETFQNLASKILNESRDELVKTAKVSLEGAHKTSSDDLIARQKAIGDLMIPIMESLSFIKTSQQTSSSLLESQIKSMTSVTLSVKDEASKIVNALKTPIVRGKWGEVQLRRVVEYAGMLKHCDFDEQETVVDSEDRMKRPDMTINLPNGRKIVVDAKVPLSAFMEAIDIENELHRGEKLKTHAQQLRAHVDSLRKKEYWSQFSTAPDFVFLFVPQESIYSAALQADSSLIEHAANGRVIIASPTILLTLLQAVAYGWKETALTENAEKIASLGKELYERLSVFSTHYSTLRKNLQNTVNNFNDSVGSLETKVLPSARKIKELGISSLKEIEVLEPIQTVPRDFKAPELLSSQELDDNSD